MGTLWGKSAGVTQHSGTIYADILLGGGSSIPIDADADERAVLVTESTGNRFSWSRSPRPGRPAHGAAIVPSTSTRRVIRSTTSAAFSVCSWRRSCCDQLRAVPGEGALALGLAAIVVAAGGCLHHPPAPGPWRRSTSFSYVAGRRTSGSRRARGSSSWDVDGGDVRGPAFLQNVLGYSPSTQGRVLPRPFAWCSISCPARDVRPRPRAPPSPARRLCLCLPASSRRSSCGRTSATGSRPRGRFSRDGVGFAGTPALDSLTGSVPSTPALASAWGDGGPAA